MFILLISDSWDRSINLLAYPGYFTWADLVPNQGRYKGEASSLFPTAPGLGEAKRASWDAMPRGRNTPRGADRRLRVRSAFSTDGNILPKGLYSWTLRPWALLDLYLEHFAELFENYSNTCRNDRTGLTSPGGESRTPG